MRNLQLIHSKQLPINITEPKFILSDVNGKQSLKYVANTNNLYRLNLDGGAAAEVLAEVPSIVGAEYLALDNEICLATEMGEVLLINPQTGDQREGTFCDVGLECMAWSPDQEVVVFITKTHSVVVMTCTYDALAEHDLSAECAGDGQFMNVGWGKKETQFHGSEGKTAAKQRSDLSAPTNIDQLPQNIEITWRADGNYFAVSFVSAEAGRMFKVFNKEGKLNYTSERTSELQPPIAWRPSGTWVAVPQRLPNKSIVALFEKNGLRHREIVLPFTLDEEIVCSLKWSSDSDILAIETQNLATQWQHVYLYTIGNYHWYLKQLLRFQPHDPLAAYSWDQRMGEEKTLHVLCASGQYYAYKWHWAIAQSTTGTVAVIDGKKLLITDFGKAVVPPPMSSRELTFDAPLNVCKFTKTNGLIAIDANSMVYTFNGGEMSRYQAVPVPLPLHWYDGSDTSKHTIEDSESCLPLHPPPLEIANIVELQTRLFLVALASNSSSTPFYKLELTPMYVDEMTACYAMKHIHKLDGVTVSDIVVQDCAAQNNYCVYAQTADGNIRKMTLRVCPNSTKVAASNTSQTTVPCYNPSTVKVVADICHASLTYPIDQLLSGDEGKGTFGSAVASLTHNNCLYIDGKNITNDVTSICAVDNKYLAFTKLQSLYFLRLSDLTVLGERKIERGGKLIASIYNGNEPRIVLQLPRGNLETICPRIFSFNVLAKMLAECRYNEALEMLRKQRINLNILCDHNMVNFIENVVTFLNYVEPSWLILFINELQNEDFTKTMYAEYYDEAPKQDSDEFSMNNKVQWLASLLCRHMKRSQDCERFSLPIITAYVKTGEPEKALLMIWDRKKMEHGSGDPSTKPIADDWLKYLLYLVDVNQLYNIALGTYDLGLVLFVVQKSQKDPKEYLLFLNELKRLDVNYRHFRIDEHIKSYAKALQHIARCGAERFPEALEFIKRHQLFVEALQCEWDEQCLRQVCLAFGDHLRSNGKHENASIMYERGGNISQALLSAKHVLDWQRVMALIGRDTTATQEEKRVQQVAASLAAGLKESGRHDEAYQLLKTFGDSYVEALKCLLEGKLFLKAINEERMRIVCDENSAHVDMLEFIEPSLLDYANLLNSNIQQDRDIFTSHCQRLALLRRQQRTKGTTDKDAYSGVADIADIDEIDLLSDTSSMNSSRYTSASSRGTGKTFRSSKNRRKHERKLFSLKPGNPFEDIAIIDALHRLVGKIAAQQQHVHDTCKSLIELRHDQQAAKIQYTYKIVLHAIKDALAEIWLPEMLPLGKSQLDGTTAPGQSLSLYMQYNNEQRYSLLAPSIRLAPQLNIIDWEHDILNYRYTAPVEVNDVDDDDSF